MLPVVGAAADVANGVWYAAEGNYTDAALSFASAVSGVGDAVGAAVYGNLKMNTWGCIRVKTSWHGLCQDFTCLGARLLRHRAVSSSTCQGSCSGERRNQRVLEGFLVIGDYRINLK